jgi:hypothetical protein
LARRRSSSSVTNLLSGIADDIKDFVDDEVIDRGRDTERDLRRVGRNLTESRDDDRGGRSTRDDEIAQLRAAISSLSDKIGKLAGSDTGTSSTKQ